MDFSTVARISASGMQFQKARVEAATMNLANIGTVANAEGALFQPVEAVAMSAGFPLNRSFASVQSALSGVFDVQIRATSREPIRSYEPGNPAADVQGYVQHPDIDHLNEMMTLTSAVRTYEANLAAIQSARTMFAKALEIGGNS